MVGETAMNKKRILGSILICLTIFIAAALVYLKKTDAFATAGSMQGNKGVTEITVSSRLVADAVTMAGRFQPIRFVTINAPFSGKVERVNVRYGDTVRAGQVLFTMDVSDIEITLREARGAYLEADELYRQVSTWADSAEVARAKRTVAKARISLDSQKKSLEEADRLFKKGIIATNEMETLRQQYQAQQLDFRTAEEELRAVQSKGSTTSVQLARYKWQNAQARLKQLEKAFANATVVAPADGIVIRPPSGDGGKENKSIERWSSVQQGDALLAIGDLSGFAVVAKADELDVTRIAPGQKVRISGEALPGAFLDGVISTIASQNTEADSRTAPVYAVTVIVGRVTPEQRKKIFVGMSALLEIVTREQNTVMVPHQAVLVDNTTRFVMKRQTNGLFARTPVEVGSSRADGMEIVRGVVAGDVIRLREPVQMEQPEEGQGTLRRLR